MKILDEKANVLYTLMADKPFVDPNTLIREHLERVVTVKGDLYSAPVASGSWRSRKSPPRRTLAPRRTPARPRTPASRSSPGDRQGGA